MEKSTLRKVIAFLKGAGYHVGHAEEEVRVATRSETGYVKTGAILLRITPGPLDLQNVIELLEDGKYHVTKLEEERIYQEEIGYVNTGEVLLRITPVPLDWRKASELLEDIGYHVLKVEEEIKSTTLSETGEYIKTGVILLRVIPVCSDKNE
ncbi:MAG: hypothetical protein LBK00_05595 [Treponema sp.]|jgi:hypothetical protein|nr:hypothetical protein [Treponema sp.]